MHALPCLLRTAVVALAAGASISSPAQPAPPPPGGPPGAAGGETDPDADMTVVRLKRDYARCERLAARGLLDPGQAMPCSVVYERLKAQAFGGDFAALHRWWQAERDRGGDER